MAHSNSLKAIFYAFSANLGIALAKTGAAFWTGSGALLAEAIHSYADCGNQILLFIGLKRAEKQPTLQHPMGYGREPYIWSMMVAFTLFSVGGVFSIHEGWQRYNEIHELENAGIALLILLIASGMEYLSLKGALTAMQGELNGRSLWQWFRETPSSELMVVIGEDIAALLGLVIAFIMLGLALITGNTIYDAIGSILIGILLISVAIIVGREIHSLLLGESAREVQSAIHDFLAAQDDVCQVFNVWAIYHGKQIMLAVKVEMSSDQTVGNTVTRINTLEKMIKQQHPQVAWIFFELDDKA